MNRRKRNKQRQQTHTQKTQPILNDQQKSGEQAGLTVLMMEYQNLHQRVVQHVEMGMQNTIQALIAAGAILAFSVAYFYDDSMASFVNMAMFLVLPSIALSLVASILSNNIKISAYGEYLSTVEKRINHILNYSNKPDAKANERIVDWERWRGAYGIAQDKLVFFDGSLLYIMVLIGSFVSPVIRFKYINVQILQHIRLWSVAVPFLFSLYFSIIIILLLKLKVHRSKIQESITTESITYDTTSSNVKKIISKTKPIRVFSLVLGLYLILQLALFSCFPFSFYRYNEELTFNEHQVIAHRGLHDDFAPENTLPAFSKAIEKNYAIELDVWTSKDGTPIVIHDNDLSRLCHVNKKITDLTLDEIKELKVLQKETIPTLEEALTLINGQVPVIVEIKANCPSNRDNYAILELLSSYSGSYSVQAFSPLQLYWMKHHNPDVPRGQLLGNWGVFSSKLVFCLRDNLFCYISDPNYINYDREVVQYASLDQAKALGIPIVSWLFKMDELNNLPDTLQLDGLIVEN